MPILGITHNSLILDLCSFPTEVEIPHNLCPTWIPAGAQHNSCDSLSQRKDEPLELWTFPTGITDIPEKTREQSGFQGCWERVWGDFHRAGGGISSPSNLCVLSGNPENFGHSRGCKKDGLGEKSDGFSRNSCCQWLFLHPLHADTQTHSPKSRDKASMPGKKKSSFYSRHSHQWPLYMEIEAHASQTSRGRGRKKIFLLCCH